MKNCSFKADTPTRETPASRSYDLLGEEQGCRNGCKAGITEHMATEFPASQSHDDQEGFYVLSGTGWGRLGGAEIHLEPGMALIAPPGIPHAFKRDEQSPYLELFWFHAAQG